MRATALLFTAAFTAVAALPGHAQIGGVVRDIANSGVIQPEAPGWLAQRLVGRWKKGDLTVVFWGRPDGTVYADAYLPLGSGAKRWLSGALALNSTRTAMEGTWHDTSTAVERWQGGQWSVSFVNNQVVFDGLVYARTHIQKLDADDADLVSPHNYADWLGEWQVRDGRLRLFMEQGRLMGTFRVPSANGLMETRRELLFSGKTDRYETDGDTLVGLWQNVGDPPVSGGEARMTLLGDKKSFGGTLEGDPQYGAWRGQRAQSGSGSASDSGSETLPPPTPVPAPPPPVTPSTPAPVPGSHTPIPSEPAPAADGFEPLGRWDVRVDKVENPRDDKLTHVYLTLRNAGTQTLLQTGDVWVYLETSDGMTQRSGQGVRAVPGPPQLFGSPPPVVMPGKEIRAKYVFDRHRGVTLTSIMVMEGEHRADFAF